MESKLIKFDKGNIRRISSLAIEAKEEGYRFVQRTINEWLEGINDFSKPGEVFYGLEVNSEIVSIGGVNVEPYVKADRLGRIRHVYTSKKYREKGYSRIILEQVIEESKGHFDKLRLSTYNLIAAYYYEKLGFKRKIEYRATHVLDIKKGL